MDEMTLDPRKGFVALPLDLLEIDMSPGAFRTLTEFCRMANRDGECWPSLDQIGARLGRSRAAISGYVAELRELGLIDTTRQRTANGFNYRLKFRVTFWSRWRTAYTGRGKGAVDQSTERGVQPVERLKSQNQNQENQSPAAKPVDHRSGLEELAREWAVTVGRAPYPRFDIPPTQDLVRRTAAIVAKKPRPSGQSNAGPDTGPDTGPEPALAAFFSARQVAPAPDVLRELGRIARRSGREPEDILARLARCWKPHWRRAPSAAQFSALIDPAPAETAPGTLIRLLQSHLRRARRHDPNFLSPLAISADMVTPPRDQASTHGIRSV